MKDSPKLNRVNPKYGEDGEHQVNLLDCNFSEFGYDLAPIRAPMRAFKPSICYRTDFAWLWMAMHLALFQATDLCAQPRITSFSPVAAGIGSSVVISGSNFGTGGATNIVYFGAVKGAVTSSSANSLTVTVPVGATYAPITVTANGLTAYSRLSFAPTFPSDHVINEASFGARLEISVNYPGTVEVADLDGDGKPDLVTTQSAGVNRIWIRRNVSTPGNLSDAAFESPVTLDAGSGVDGLVMAVADFDGDGKLDLAALHYDTQRFYIFRNVSTPGVIAFASALEIGIGFSTRRVAVGDLDSDGKPDLLVGSSTGFSALRNTTVGTNLSFAPKVDFPLVSASLAVGDLDGDGKPEVVGPDYNQSVSITQNKSGAGAIDANSFAPIVQFLAGDHPYSIAVGDLDGDGKLDLAAANQSAGTVSVLRNVGSPGTITSNSFASKVDLVAATNDLAYGIRLGDLDGDGKPDIALADGVGSTVFVFKNLSTPGAIGPNSFGAAVSLNAGSGPAWPTIADLDGDGKPEIIANLYDARLIAILPNIAAAPKAITSQPQSLTVAAGSNATFSVAATGALPLGFQWRFNSTNNVVGATNSALTLPNAQPLNAGIYDVMVTNQGGSITSQVAMLTVDTTFVRLTNSVLETTTSTSLGATAIDYNNDGNLDLLFVDRSIGSGIMMFRNNGGANFGRINNSITAESGYTDGAAWADYDNDGNMDLVIAKDHSENAVLFRNTGGGTFARMGEYSNPGYTVNWADYDNDGFCDFYLPGIANGKLFHNNGDGTFSTVGGQAITTTSWDSASGVWGDYDNDGKPDVWVANTLTGGGASSLFHNDGAGTFSRVANSAISAAATGSQAGAWGDYDNDGDLDLVVVDNEGAPANLLFRNDGTNGFTLITNALGTDFYPAIHCHWVDYDNDGWLDLFLPNQSGIGAMPRLYRNNRDGTFTVMTNGALATDTSGAGAAVWGDFNRDGFVDVALGGSPGFQTAPPLARKCASKPPFKATQSGNFGRFQAGLAGEAKTWSATSGSATPLTSTPCGSNGLPAK